VGYGFRSIEGIVNATRRVEAESADLPEAQKLAGYQKTIKEIDDEGIIATPANSAFNELVVEAGRMSILSGGRDVIIEYGDNPHVRFKELSEYSEV
jgi:hypothetical protein